MTQQAGPTTTQAATAGSDKARTEDKGKTGFPAPYAGKPLDGSQYHDVVEEQVYAEQRPSAEEQTPRRARVHGQPDDKHDDKH